MTTISPATCYLQQQRTSGNLHLIDHQVLRWWQHSLSTVFPARTMTMVQHPNLPQHHQWCHARPRPLQPLVTCNDEDHQVSSTSLIAKYWDYGNAHHAVFPERKMMTVGIPTSPVLLMMMLCMTTTTPTTRHLWQWGPSGKLHIASAKLQLV